MKKLIGKGFIVLFIIIFILGTLMVTSANPLFSDKLNLLTDSGGYAGFGTDEVASVLDIIDNDTEATKLIIGDSVAAQLFVSQAPENYLVATGNQAMTFMWQYFFAERFINTHPDAADVYIAVTPDSLTTLWNSTLSYQYVVMPLVKFGYYDRLDATSKDELLKIYGKKFMEETMVSFIDRSGINRKLFLNGLDKIYSDRELYTKEATAVSGIAKEYLLKTYTLCEENGVQMHLICCPVKDTPENRSDLEALVKDYMSTEIGSIFPKFFDGLMYYSPGLFKDNIHFKDNVLTHEFKREIIEKIKENTGEFSGL